ELAGEDRGRLPGHHADVPGHGDGGESAAAHRLYQDAETGRTGRRTGEIGRVMTTAPVQKERNSYLDAPHGIASWLLTKDHKRIAMLYLISITIFFAIGGLFALGIRLELLTPKGDLVSSDTYNKMFTLHGVVMIFFFLIPSIPATLGNFLIPIMVGAKDLAFPRINLLSWYLYVIGGIIALAAVAGGGLDTGWTFYTPYSTQASQTSVTLAAMAAFTAGFSSILTGF